ncbi:MAG TPA: heme-binding protein, partial [Xanthobacteraceae bacterium]|nr:heme-binding protein [Xanthobacteraceae bacterium]
MSLLIRIVGGVAGAVALSSVTMAQGVLTEKNISLGLAKEIADVALDTCQKTGYAVSVTVINRAGLVVLQYRGDKANLHTIENSQRKAYTARTFRRPSGEWAAQVTS